MTVRQSPWTARTVFERAREVLREEGLKSLAFRTIGEIGYRRVILFDLDVRAERAERAVRPALAGLRFEQLSHANMRDFAAIAQLCDEAEARRRLAAGQVCILGYLGEKPAYCCWLALAGQRVWIDFLNVEAELAPRCAYSYELYVPPEFRRSGIARAALDYRIRLMRDLGIDRLSSVVVPENRAGRGHTRAAGLQPIGRIHVVRLLGLQRCWIRSDVEPPPFRVLS